MDLRGFKFTCVDPSDFSGHKQGHWSAWVESNLNLEVGLWEGSCLLFAAYPRGDKVSMLTHTYPHKPIRLKWPYAITRLTAHIMSGLMSDLVICKFRKSMVTHDTKCPYWDQVSLNNPNPNPNYLLLLPTDLAYQLSTLHCACPNYFNCVNSYSASHNNWCTETLLNRVITAQWEGMGDAGSARYEPALHPSSLTIRVLSYMNCQRSTHSSNRAWQFKC